MLASFSTVPAWLSLILVVLSAALFWVAYARFVQSNAARLALLIPPAVGLVLGLAASGIKHYPVRLTFFVVADALIAFTLILFVLRGFVRESVAAQARGEKLAPTSGQTWTLIGTLVGSMAVLLVLEATIFSGFFRGA